MALTTILSWFSKYGAWPWSIVPRESMYGSLTHWQHISRKTQGGKEKNKAHFTTARSGSHFGRTGG